MACRTGRGRVLGIAGLGVLGAAAAVPARAEFRHDLGEVAITANAGYTLSGALFDDPETEEGVEEAVDLDAWGSINAEWTSDGGVVIGAFASGDTADNRPDTLKNDRLYGYASTEWGRAEIGLTSGPARRMSFYAPLVGSGQVRGDFARYAGTSALLWPFDTRQSFKLAYFSPPLAGLRFGVSWAPELERLDTVQGDAFELAAQYERPVGRWVVGASAAYVHGRAENPGLEDLESWSLGFQARRDRLVIGGAYVDRGDSNLFRNGFDQSEINLGVAWRETDWAVALSAARTTARGFDNELVGIGGSYNVAEHLSLTADLVGMREEDALGREETGFVLVAGIDLHL